MSDIAKAFDHGKAFIAFVTAGDPCLEVTEKLIPAMAAAGADLIEIGIPFSDPVAEGSTIQKADERSLSAGTDTDGIFQMVANVRRETAIPLVFMTYINPVFAYGADDFCRRCSEVGISALIVPDMPYEEKGELLPYCRKHGIDLISLIAPTSQNRIKMIASEAEGFVYCVSSLGVTGVRSKITTDIGSMISLVKEVSDIPCAVGFGISTPEQAKEIASVSDGVIVGSAIMQIIEKYGHECLEPVCEYVRSMKHALS